MNLLVPLTPQHPTSKGPAAHAVYDLPTALTGGSRPTRRPDRLRERPHATLGPASAGRLRAPGLAERRSTRREVLDR